MPAPVYEKLRFFLFEPFKSVPDLEEVGTEPFTADQRVRDVLPSGIPVFRFLFPGEQVGTGAQELAHVAVVGQVQPVVPVIFYLHEMLCGHGNLCIVQIHILFLLCMWSPGVPFLRHPKGAVSRLCWVFRGNTAATGKGDFPENRLRHDLAQPSGTRTTFVGGNGTSGHLHTVHVHSVIRWLPQLMCILPSLSCVRTSNGVPPVNPVKRLVKLVLLELAILPVLFCNLVLVPHVYVQDSCEQVGMAVCCCCCCLHNVLV